MPTERVLVVDDDSAILTLCHRILEADGYQVVDAKRGEEALAKLEAESFDLLLTDIRLPGLNGLEMTERLRQMGLELTVVTMTGYSNMEMAIRALSLGVDEFIVKPFTPETLRVHVARALEKTRLRRENTRLWTLVPLLQTAQAFVAARTRDQVYAKLFAGVNALLKTDEMAFFELGREPDVLLVAAAQGNVFAALRDMTVSHSELNNPDALSTMLVRVWNEAQEKRLPFALPGITWVIRVPLQARDAPLGLLFAATEEPVSQGDAEALQLVASQAATALENADLLAEISRAYLNARELERLKSEFINIAGHELRTPLAVTLGYATILRDQLKGELQDYAREVVSNAERIQRIADDFLNLKYLEGGHVDLRLERLPVDQVVQEVVNAYRPLAQQREQQIEIRVEPQAGDVTADRAMLDLMLGSLLSNAIKFSPRNTCVRVAARGDSDKVTLVVRDEGQGMSNEEAERVFDAFYQASNSLTRDQGGLGLGLTLAKAMAQAHGGEIWVETEKQQGSAFFITLPRVTSEIKAG